MIYFCNSIESGFLRHNEIRTELEPWGYSKEVFFKTCCFTTFLFEQIKRTMDIHILVL